MLLLYAIPIPVIGTTVRYRVTFYPKPQSWDHSDQVAAEPSLEVEDEPSKSKIVPDVAADITGDSALDLEAGPAPNSAESKDNSASNVAPQRGPPTFFGVCRNVWKHSGFSGLYQGYLPILLLNMLGMRIFVTPAPLPYVEDPYFILPLNVLYMYFLIATYRLIVSPHKFKINMPKLIYEQTFTEYERAHPFRFLQYSGIVGPYLVGLVFYQYIYQPIFVYNATHVGAPFNVPSGREYEWYKFLDQPNWLELMRIVILFGMIIVATLLWTPVHVVVTRLAIQPVHGQPNADAVEEREAHKLVGMGVIVAPSHLHLSTERPPYLGFKDCFTKIRQEEGWGALYRSWWLVALGFYLFPLQ